MRINRVQFQIGKTAHCKDFRSGLRDLQPEPAHTRIDGDRAPDHPVLTDRLGADPPGHFQIVERTDQPVFNRRRDFVRQQVAEDLHRQSERNQFDRLVDFRHAEHRRPGRANRLRNRKDAEPVGVRLQHGGDPRRSDPPADLQKILRQFPQVHFKFDPTLETHSTTAVLSAVSRTA